MALLTPEDERAKKRASGKARRAAKQITKREGVIADAIVIAYKPLDEWDIDELARKRPRAHNGTWQGSSPKWITKALQDEAQRRFQAMGRDMLSDHLASAVKVVSELATNEDVDDDEKPIVPPSVRLQAATYLIDQVLGRATARVELEAGDSVRSLLAGALVLPDGKPATIIEGEVVEPDEMDEGEI